MIFYGDSWKSTVRRRLATPIYNSICNLCIGFFVQESLFMFFFDHLFVHMHWLGVSWVIIHALIFLYHLSTCIWFVLELVIMHFFIFPIIFCPNALVWSFVSYHSCIFFQSFCIHMHWLSRWLEICSLHHCILWMLEVLHITVYLSNLRFRQCLRGASIWTCAAACTARRTTLVTSSPSGW